MKKKCFVLIFTFTLFLPSRLQASAHDECAVQVEVVEAKVAEESLNVNLVIKVLNSEPIPGGYRIIQCEDLIGKTKDVVIKTDAEELKGISIGNILNLRYMFFSDIAASGELWWFKEDAPVNQDDKQKIIQQGFKNKRKLDMRREAQVQDGVRRNYNTFTGVLIREENVVGGVRQGMTKEYYRDGTVKSESMYEKQGEVSKLIWSKGYFKSRALWFERNEKYFREYDLKGHLVEEEIFENY